MREVEITLKINETLEVCSEKLENNGFKLIREGYIDDIYMSAKKKDLTRENIDDILKKSVLIRCIKENDKILKKITYKNKVYDENNNVLIEEKININCEDLENAKKLFLALDFEELVSVKYKYSTFSNGKIEYCFHKVENLGLLMECESKKDFTNASKQDVIDEKNMLINEFLKYGISIESKTDVKKAYELIMKSLIKKEQHRYILDEMLNENYTKILDLGSGRTSMNLLLDKFENSNITGVCYPGDNRKLDKIKQECTGDYLLLEKDICKDSIKEKYDLILCHLLFGEAIKFNNTVENMAKNVFNLKSKEILVIDYLEDIDIDFEMLINIASQQGYEIIKKEVFKKTVKEEYNKFIGEHYIAMLFKIK
jgi:predicted adenylyl cyclase CyaB